MFHCRKFAKKYTVDLEGWPCQGSIIKRCLQCGCCSCLALSLSALSVLDQAGKAVPGFLLVHHGWELNMISMSIGVVQSLLIKAVVPSLAAFLSPNMRFLAGIVSLFVVCVIPALVIVYLDSACLGHWTAPQWLASYRAILRYYRSYRAIPFQGGRHCDTPPLVLSFTHAHLCDTPFCYISREKCAIPP